MRKYRIPPEKYYKNIDHYGNTAAASVPLVLSELEDQGRIGPGSRLLMVAFGGGLTWGGAVLEMHEIFHSLPPGTRRMITGAHHEKTQ